MMSPTTCSANRWAALHYGVVWTSGGQAPATSGTLQAGGSAVAAGVVGRTAGLAGARTGVGATTGVAPVITGAGITAGLATMIGAASGAGFFLAGGFGGRFSPLGKDPAPLQPHTLG